MGCILDNIVYLELLYRDFKVKIGNAGEKEIDFMAERTSDKICIQVSDFG
jgi:predicted AAA+ superfamily ATPase